MTAETVLADRYRLAHRLGNGGMGDVWLAHDLLLHRTVAIKTVRPAVSEDLHAERRLRREARTLASLSHPRLAQVYDFCEKGDCTFIVMEFVDGESLADRLTREPPPPAEAARIIAQCASALDTAHQAGIVHRDVKPSNIMLTGSGGNVKLIDFGIAATTEPSNTTATVGLIGTVAYLAPERAAGAQATAAADVYSLGVVLYRLLAGRMPFEADESIAMLFAHATAKPPPLPASVPAPLARICLDMLAKDPAARPLSGTVATALQKASVLKPLSARPAAPAPAPSATSPASASAPVRQPDPAALWRPSPLPTAPAHSARSPRPAVLSAAGLLMIALLSLYYML
ncbi:MAG TPA: serine/threonine-protein kinase [Actinocrinis sp.]|nr:serine/threonine-protein kinase [Actinocrinis sp.]